MTNPFIRRRPALASLALSSVLVPAAGAQVLPASPVGFVSEDGGRIVGVTERPAPRLDARFVELETVKPMGVTTLGLRIIDESLEGGFGRGDCIERSAYVADLDPGGYNAQAGFAEGEIMAAQFVLSPSDFPIKIEQMNGLFATAGTSVTTTTEWSILVWEGPPNTGTLVASFSSDDIILPHLVMPPGNGGTEIQVSVDPGDPEQIIIASNPTNSFTIGFRIDEHNNQTQNPCFFAPPAGSNAFPTTDTDGLASSANNWIFAVDCGPLGCRAGWSRFSQFAPCTPSGDWGIEALWSSISCGPSLGACCEDGDCSITTEALCNGVYGGDDTTCDDIVCLAPDEACCFEDSGGCLDLPPEQCMIAGGIPGGPGTECATFVCFPEGACCLPDGSCADGMSPEDCAAANGVFQGDGTVCGPDTCPEPEGACAFKGGGCLSLTEGDCAIASGQWCGAGSTCDDDDGNGTPDDCEVSCPADLAEPFGTLDFSDVLAFLTAFSNMEAAADLALPIGTFDFSDVIAFLESFGGGCP